MDLLEAGTFITDLVMGDDKTHDGVWFVHAAAMGGGSTGRDPWPDGWQLQLVKVPTSFWTHLGVNDRLEIAFPIKLKEMQVYQEGLGCFIPSVTLISARVIGKAISVWRVTEKGEL
jgi:hypothetical protein